MELDIFAEAVMLALREATLKAMEQVTFEAAMKALEEATFEAAMKALDAELDD